MFLTKLNFPNYQNYNEINEAYNDFFQKIMSVIDKFMSMKERRQSKTLGNVLMGKLKIENQSKLKIVISYLKSLKNHIDNIDSTSWTVLIIAYVECSEI